MLITPSFESSLLVTDDPALAARVSALFVRPGRYFPVIDGPRLGRSDASNEIVRRRNAMVLTSARHILMGGLAAKSVEAMRPGWPNLMVSDQYSAHLEALRGMVRRPKGVFHWGPDNLGTGLYQARLARQELELDLEVSPAQDLLRAGRHLLIACERGDPLSDVTASNLAFASGASLAFFPEQTVADQDAWLEEIYALGEGADLTGRFNDLATRARAHLAIPDLEDYKTVLFVTAGFPWGIAAPKVASTHMYRKADFGRGIVEGLWASHDASRESRTALLVDPMMVDGSEIDTINQALLRNGTLTRVLRGPAATQGTVQFQLDLLPHDVIVISSHAGDAPGERITYRYPDEDGRVRTLVVDRALGIGGKPFKDKYRVMEYHRFHSLDGVDWRDKTALAALPVGTAMTSWSGLERWEGREEIVVARESIERVVGSMAIKLHDGTWLFASHSFAPESAPLFINNSCWSWHELSNRAMFAGARGYLGSLYPITDAEAQEMATRVFVRYIGENIVHALWKAQRDIYGDSSRRPFVLVGLPFIAIRRNTSDSVTHLAKAYTKSINHWRQEARESPHKEIRENAEQYTAFLIEDQHNFENNLVLGPRTLQSLRQQRARR